MVIYGGCGLLVVGFNVWWVCYGFLSFIFYLDFVANDGFRWWWVPICGGFAMGVVVCYRFFGFRFCCCGFGWVLWPAVVVVGFDMG